MNTPKYLSRLFLSLTFLAGLCGSAFAAPDSEWPKKPIMAILSFPAGGSTDVFARAVAAPLGEALGQSVVIENKPGAGGMVGLGAAAKAAPDGYTIHISAMINRSLKRSSKTRRPTSLKTLYQWH